MGDLRHSSAPIGGTEYRIPDHQQHIHSTPCRRTGPRRWLRAVTWAVAAGLHPKATATTLAVAEDLAGRMHFDTGHVLYGLDKMVARLGLSRSCITAHIRILREMGLLAWVQQGTRANIRRALGLKGYAGTATVYAATIPPAYDTAMGHRTVGAGYTARVVVDYRTMPKPSGESSLGDSHDGSPETPQTAAKRSSWTPSLNVVKEEEKVQVSGGFTTTAGAAANHEPAPTNTDNATGSRRGGKGRDKASRKRTTICGQPITGRMIAEARRLAPHLRARVNWLQKASYGQLSWVLLDPIAWGWDEEQIVSWCYALGRVSHDGRPWRPRCPHRVLAKHLRAEHDQATVETGLVTAAESPSWQAYLLRQSLAALATEAANDLEDTTPARTDEDRRIARYHGMNDLAAVADHVERDPDDALDLYGTYLCTRAIRLTASTHFTQGA